MNRFKLGEKMYGILEEVMVMYLQDLIRGEKDAIFYHHEDAIRSKQLVSACYTLLDHFCVSDDMKKIIEDLEEKCT